MKRKQTAILIVFLLIIYAGPLSAQTQVPPAKDFGQLIQNIFGWALALVGAAVFVNFLWAGFLWFTAAGRPGPIGQAKEKMTNALIGAIILLASFLILKTINPDLVRQTFTLEGIQQPANQQQQSNSNQQNNSFFRDNSSNQNLSAGGDADDTVIFETINDILYGNYGPSEIEEKARQAGLIVGRFIPSDQYDPEFIVIRHPKTKTALMNILVSPVVINTGPGTSQSCGFFWEQSCGGFGAGGGSSSTESSVSPYVPGGGRGGGPAGGGGLKTSAEFENTLAICRNEESKATNSNIIMVNGKPYGTTKPQNSIKVKRGDVDYNLYINTLTAANGAVNFLNRQFSPYPYSNLPKFKMENSNTDGDITLVFADFTGFGLVDPNDILMLAINSRANIGRNIYEHATILINANLITKKKLDNESDLITMLLHEFGHLLSLAHDENDPFSLMWPTEEGSMGTTSFKASEILALLDIYNKSPKELKMCEDVF